MAMYFDKIGKSIDKFLKAKEYKLDRRAEFEVTADNVTWKAKTILKDSGVESELNLSVGKGQETFGFETTTKASSPPEFSVSTKRFSKYLAGSKLKYKDPVTTMELKRASGKTAQELKVALDGSTRKADATMNICYKASDYVYVGGETKFEVDPDNRKLASYAVGVQWKRNSSQTVAALLKGTEQSQTGVLGLELKNFYKTYTGYFQGQYNMQDAGVNLQLGASRPLGSSTLLKGVYRYSAKSSTASAMFVHTMKENKVNAFVAVNTDLKNGGNSLEYKLVFG